MKAAKIISLEACRAGRPGRGKKTGRESAGIPFPSSDKLWVLLDRNINAALWLDHD